MRWPTEIYTLLSCVVYFSTCAIAGDEILEEIKPVLHDCANWINFLQLSHTAQTPLLDPASGIHLGSSSEKLLKPALPISSFLSLILLFPRIHNQRVGVYNSSETRNSCDSRKIQLNAWLSIQKLLEVVQAHLMCMSKTKCLLSLLINHVDCIIASVSASLVLISNCGVAGTLWQYQ